MRNYICGFLILVMLGCFPDESPVNAPNALNITFEQDSAVDEYFYSLLNRRLVKVIDNSQWDLRFDCRKDHFDININFSRGASLAKANPTSLDLVNELTLNSLEFEYETNAQGPGVIGLWGDFSFDEPVSLETVYVLNSGYNVYGLKKRTYKFKIIEFVNNNYMLEFAELNSSKSDTLFIPKVNEYNYIYLSLADKQTLLLEPPKSTWDIKLGTITQNNINNVPIYYPLEDNYALVPALFFNPSKSLWAVDTTTSFENIDFNQINEYQYNNNVLYNVEWYRFNHPKNVIEIDSNKVLILQNEPLIHKIRITDMQYKGPLVGFGLKMKLINL